MPTPRPVQLTTPAQRSSVRLARLVAAGVAADVGLTVDDTEDLRVAVTELVALLVEGAPDPQADIEVTFRGAPGQVVVEGRRSAAGPGGDGAAVDDLALELLRVMVDEHSFTADGDGRRFHLVKRARTTV
ncbi:MAG TPA: ATP-binding protein [Acidimicrobiales bacterium]